MKDEMETVFYRDLGSRMYLVAQGDLEVRKKKLKPLHYFSFRVLDLGFRAQGPAELKGMIRVIA